MHLPKFDNPKQSILESQRRCSVLCCIPANICNEGDLSASCLLGIGGDTIINASQLRAGGNVGLGASPPEVAKDVTLGTGRSRTPDGISHSAGQCNAPGGVSHSINPPRALDGMCTGEVPSTGKLGESPN